MTDGDREPEQARPVKGGMGDPDAEAEVARAEVEWLGRVVDGDGDDEDEGFDAEDTDDED